MQRTSGFAWSVRLVSASVNMLWELFPGAEPPKLKGQPSWGNPVKSWHTFVSPGERGGLKDGRGLASR